MKQNKILIFDTSVLCCLLNVPGKETCGPTSDRWNYSRIEELITKEKELGSTFVLPVATIIETGNHIAQATGDRYSIAQKLANAMMSVANEESPWAAFEHQSELWIPDNIKQLAMDWPDLATQGIGIGDATIKDVAEFYAKTGTVAVTILTGDKGLKAYEPAAPPALIPRRRKLH